MPTMRMPWSESGDLQSALLDAPTTDAVALSASINTARRAVSVAAMLRASSPASRYVERTRIVKPAALVRGDKPGQESAGYVLLSKTLARQRQLTT